MKDPLSFEKVSVEDAKKVLEGKFQDDAPKVEEQDWRWARSSKPPPPLNDSTKTWLANLPEKVRPKELPRLYPRIANHLCDVWSDRDACERCFEELSSKRRVTGNRRDSRKGFPGEVADEIAALRRHYFNPGESATHWEDNVYRRR